MSNAAAAAAALSESQLDYSKSGVNFDPISGSMLLDNGIFKGLHRQVWCIRDERPAKVDGGTFECNKWIPRHFNVIDGIIGMGVGITDDTIINIDVGTYIVDVSCPALGVGFHQIRFQNLTNQITEVFGTTTCSHSDEHQTRSEISFHLNVLDMTKQYQIQHRCSGGRPGDGFGKASSFEDTNEIYSMMKIQKVL